MMKRVMILVFGMSLLISGCASILKGSRQEVAVSSSPTGAKFMINGEQFNTPAIVRLKRADDYFIGLYKDGYEPASVALQSHWSAVTLLNVFLLPAAPVGLLWDVVTGASHNLDPGNVHVTLMPTQR